MLGVHVACQLSWLTDGRRHVHQSMPLMWLPTSVCLMCACKLLLPCSTHAPGQLLLPHQQVGSVVQLQAVAGLISAYRTELLSGQLAHWASSWGQAGDLDSLNACVNARATMGLVMLIKYYFNT